MQSLVFLLQQARRRIAGSRLLVQKSIHDKFVSRLIEVAKTAKIRIRCLTDTHVGPVTTPQFQKVMDYLEIAKSEGANCVLGGGAYTGEGAKGKQFVEPTIFTGVSNDMRIAQEEVFGPVLSVIPFEDEAEAIAIDDINFGLAAGVGQAISDALSVSEIACRHCLGQYLQGGKLYDPIWRL